MADDIRGQIDTALQQQQWREAPLLPLLHHLQEELGCIPSHAVPAIADALGLSSAEVHGVISFYHQFRRQPAAANVVQICCAEACQAVGGQQLQDHARSSLGIQFGESSDQHQATLEPVYCLGNCACGPSVRIGDEVHGRVDSQRFDGLMAQLKGGEQ